MQINKSLDFKILNDLARADPKICRFELFKLLSMRRNENLVILMSFKISYVQKSKSLHFADFKDLVCAETPIFGFQRF